MGPELRTSLLAAVLLLTGLALLGLGWSWNALTPTSIYWSEEQAKEFVDAQSDVHSKLHNHNHNPNHEREFQAARERFEKISRELDSARVSRDRIGTYVAATGVLLILIGIGVHFANKAAE